MSRMDKKEQFLREKEQEARKENDLDLFEEKEETLSDASDTDKAKEEAAEQAAQQESFSWEELETAKAQAEEYLNLAQRVQADFDNFRRRNESVRADAYEDGARALAAMLLPVMDNLERAVEAAEASLDTQLKEGVSLVLRQLSEVFEKRGITPISRLGEKFDPQLENALMQGAPEDGEPGTVCQVFQKGYQMSGSVLRHAMVKVVPE